MFELEEGKGKIRREVSVWDHPVLGPFPRDEGRMGDVAPGHRIYQWLAEEVLT